MARVAAEDRAHALAIVSPPGMGRSRLLAECVQRLTLEGAQLLHIRPVKNDQDARWSSLRLLMSAGIGALSGLAGARPDSLSIVASLSPELAERFAPREPKDVAEMATALASALAAAAEERPIAIAIDDAQWADGASIAALGAALGQLKHSVVTLLITVAQGVVELPNELVTLESEIGREIPGLVVRLAPLTESDIAQLVVARARWCHDETERSRLTRRLMHETAGNPFYAVTLLGALEHTRPFQQDMVAWPPQGGTIDAPLPFSVPAVARHAIQLRLGELSPTTIRVLAAASVLGQSLDLDLISAIVHLSPAEVEATLPECERRHLIQFDGRRHTFAAPIIAAVIRQEAVTRGERRALERRAIDALASHQDLESRALRVELLARAAPDHAALDLAMAVVQDARKAGARRLGARALVAATQIQQKAKLPPT
jgi:predicted ATPase